MEVFMRWLTPRRGCSGALFSLALLALTALTALVALPATASEPDRLILLGTMGGPMIRPGSSSPPSAVLMIGGTPYVVDCGYEVTRRLVQAKIPLPSLRYLFITHHHSDHNLEYANLLYNAWAAGLKTRVDTFGPAGLVEMNRRSWLLNQYDIDTRIVDEGRPDPRRLVTPHEFGEGLVFQDDKVRVTALRVPHPPVSESYALKFEFAGKVVVFSGDTAYFPPLADFAKGADILVHEVMFLPAVLELEKRHPNAVALFQHLKSAHCPAPDVGRIAAAAGVKNLVLTHFVPADDPALPEDIWRRAVASTFAGRITVGKDLLEIGLDE
jgi:ribonuclease BN (tRNA processing enzyme)